MFFFSRHAEQFCKTMLQRSLIIAFVSSPLFVSVQFQLFKIRSACTLYNIQVWSNKTFQQDVYTYLWQLIFVFANYKKLLNNRVPFQGKKLYTECFFTFIFSGFQYRRILPETEPDIPSQDFVRRLITKWDFIELIPQFVLFIFTH